MGLETVELVIDIEKEFAINISDEDAAELSILGDIARYVEARTEGSTSEVSFEQALRKIIDILVANYGVPVGKANSTSHVVLDLGLD